MKATLDIPDELYRRVEARSALEGRPIRAIAVQLFQDWVTAPAAPPSEAQSEEIFSAAEIARSPWLEISRKYIRPGMNHDLDKIRESIAQASAAEYAEKLATNRG